MTRRFLIGTVDPTLPRYGTDFMTGLIAMNASKSIVITGSRDISRAVARDLFEQHLSSLLHQGRTWLLGGARGIDEWAIEWLLEHNEGCWIVVPYTSARQPAWLQPLLDQMERVVELQLPKRKNASAFRNRYMVDLCGTVFGFRSGTGSGTLRILKYALRQQREVHAIPVLMKPDDAPGDEGSAFSPFDDI